MDAPTDQAGALSRYREGPSLLEDTVNGLPDERLDAVPAGGGWNVRKIVHHILDGDDIWKMGIKIAVGCDGAEFSLAWYWEMTQPAWGERWAYGSRSIDVSLSFLRACREHVAQLVESVPDAWNRAVLLRNRDGQMERVPVGFIIQMQSDHLAHHVQRIREILNEQEGA